MPAASQYIIPDDTSREPLSGFVSGELSDRVRAYKAAKEYYDGKQKRHLSQKEGEPNDNVILNMSKVIADRTIGMLFPRTPKMQLDDISIELTEDEKWLQHVWQVNGGPAFLYKMALAGALSGHVYVRVFPQVLPTFAPKMKVLSPRQMVTYWDENDDDTPLWHTQFWQSSDRKIDNLIDYVRQAHPSGNPDLARWWLVYFQRRAGGRWGAPRSKEVWEHPYGPVEAWQHLPALEGYYGLFEGGDRHLQDKINLAASEAMRIHRYHAGPKTVVTGVDPDEIQETSIDGLWAAIEEQAKFYMLEMQNDGDYTMNLLNLLRDSILIENRTVLLSGKVTDFQRVTDASVRTVFMDALIKNLLLMASYCQGFQRLSVTLAFSAGKTIREPDLIWRESLPVDDDARIKIQTAERDMNIASRQEISAERGRNWMSTVEQIKQ